MEDSRRRYSTFAKSLIFGIQMIASVLMAVCAVILTEYINQKFFSRHQAWALFPWAKQSVWMLTVFGILWLFCLCYLTVAAGKRADDRELHLNKFDELRTELQFLLLAGTMLAFFLIGTLLFHLLANVYVLWLLRFSPRELLAAYLLSIPATFVVWSGQVIGFSSVLYALMGMRLPRVRMSKAGWAVFIAANVATAFMPGIAFGVHCAAFALGYVCQAIYTLYDEYRGACQRK